MSDPFMNVAREADQFQARESQREQMIDMLEGIAGELRQGRPLRNGSEEARCEALARTHVETALLWLGRAGVAR